MEIDKTTPTAGAIIEKEGGSALDIALHPLVLINISDHYTRAKYSTEEKNPRVIGALFGVQSGRNVEVTNSFELVYNVIEGAVVIDTDYLKAKQEQCTLFASTPLPSARTADFLQNDLSSPAQSLPCSKITTCWAGTPPVLNASLPTSRFTTRCQSPSSSSLLECFSVSMVLP
jgi:hypothetical protein